MYGRYINKEHSRNIDSHVIAMVSICYYVHQIQSLFFKLQCDQMDNGGIEGGGAGGSNSGSTNGPSASNGKAGGAASSNASVGIKGATREEHR